MGGVYITAADDFPAFCLEFIDLIEEAVVKPELELYELIAPSAIGKIYIEKDKITEISFDDPAFVIELLNSEAEYDTFRFDL